MKNEPAKSVPKPMAKVGTKLTAGSGSALGRLQKAEIQKKKGK